MDNTMLIAVTEAQAACKGKKTLRERMLAAMKVTKNYWLFTDDDKRLQAAVAAASLESPDADKERIKEEWEALKTLSAVFASKGAVSIDNIKPPKHPLGIIKMWADLK